MDNFDLNIDNYDLEDLLNLFHLNYEFNEIDMKKAKNVALKTHPDKSGLNREVFMFFMKAYKMLESIYEFKMKRSRCVSNINYESEKMETSKKTLLLKKLDGMKAGDFNKWFNNMFEKVKITDDDVDGGYGKWFKSNEDMDEDRITNKRDMEAAFNKKKAASRELIIHKGVNELSYNGGGYDLTRNKPEEYSSDIFSKLQYDDLKNAHEESIIPILESGNMKHQSYDAALEERKTITAPIEKKTAENMIKQQLLLADKEANLRAFKLAKETTKNEEKQTVWWSKFKQILDSK